MSGYSTKSEISCPVYAEDSWGETTHLVIIVQQLLAIKCFQSSQHTFADSTNSDGSDDFVFDNQMLSQALYFGFRVGEISCPTKYFAEASSINLQRSAVYGVGVLQTSFSFRLQRLGLTRSPLFAEDRDLRLQSQEAAQA